MRILAMDTTAQFGSMALLEGEQVLEEVVLHSPEGFGHVLYGQLAALLKRHGITVDHIDCFAAAAGPGSFTGVRIGLTAVKGLAEATGRPAAGVSNLQALAACGTATFRAPLIDARRGEIYGAVYDRDLRAVVPEVVAPFRTWLEKLPRKDVEIISQDFTPFRAALVGTALENIAVRDGLRAIAGAVGRVAYKRQFAGLDQDPALLDANYVRRSDAELMWKES